MEKSKNLDFSRFSEIFGIFAISLDFSLPPPQVTGKQKPRKIIKKRFRIVLFCSRDRKQPSGAALAAIPGHPIINGFFHKKMNSELVLLSNLRYRSIYAMIFH